MFSKTAHFLVIVFIVGVGAAFFEEFRAIFMRFKGNHFIARYSFPIGVYKKIQKSYPYLALEEIERVIAGLRQYFIVCALAKGRFISMPSRVVDVAWHEFILHTRDYKAFCDKAFGKFLHHTPAVALNKQDAMDKGSLLCWKLACSLEKINPQYPEKLPLLFSLDGDLKIPDGFIHKINCSPNHKGEYSLTGVACGGCGSSWFGSSQDHCDSAGNNAGSDSCDSGCGGD